MFRGFRSEDRDQPGEGPEENTLVQVLHRLRGRVYRGFYHDGQSLCEFRTETVVVALMYQHPLPGSPGRRSAPGGDHSALGRRPHVRDGRQPRLLRDGHAGGFRCQLHHQLPGAARQGHTRQLRGVRRSHDDDTRGHALAEAGEWWWC